MILYPVMGKVNIDFQENNRDQNASDWKNGGRIMGNYLNVGNAGFTAVRKGTYVDKSGMISFINHTLGTTNKLTCVSRPRRFGKSFAAKMLCAYYDKSCDSRALFEGLEISKDASFERHLNKYDVIYLDITEFTSDAFIKKEMQNVVTNLESRVIDELSGAYPDIEKQNSLPGISEGSRLSFEEIQRWYDGYILGNNTHIYSPKSVIDAIQRNRIGNYWTQSESYESLKLYIEMDEDGLKETVIQMLGGARMKIDVATFQNDMTTITCKDDVLTLLIHLGYLAYDMEKKSVYIPNEEVREEFVRAVTTGKHTEIAKLIRSSDQLLEATLNMDEETVAAAIEQAHKAGPLLEKQLTRRGFWRR